MLILIGSIVGTLCLLVAVFVPIVVFAVYRNRRIQAATAAALPGFTAVDAAGTRWYVGEVGGRPVAVGSVVVQVNKRIGRHGRRVQRRTRLVTPLATLKGGTLYCPAGYTEPSVEEGTAQARAALIAAAASVGVAYWDPEQVRPAELPMDWLRGARGVLWFDLRGVESDGELLRSQAEDLARLAGVVE